MRPKLYGNAPQDLGFVDLQPTEMMFWLYCPIKIAGELRMVYPANLVQFEPLVDLAARTAVGAFGPEWFKKRYVYVTAKTLFVTPDNPGNRPGWHSDGFMTDDLNFIWSDKNPTLFWVPDSKVVFAQDCALSLPAMEACAEPDKAHHVTYPDKHLLLLNESVIHRVNDVDTAEVRTFVKISFSLDRYNLSGNSINHELDLDWAYVTRSEQRNHPAPGL